jgi:hypothetical protein
MACSLFLNGKKVLQLLSAAQPHLCATTRARRMPFTSFDGKLMLVANISYRDELQVAAYHSPDDAKVTVQ